LVLLLIIMALWPAPFGGQSTATPGSTQENRWLLVVETSRSMHRRKEGTLQSLQQALATGMNGQLRRWDTLGIWTFNEQLYTGRFPLAEWSPERAKDFTNHVLSFLQDQKYEKQGRLDRVIPVLNSLVKKSPYITIILVSDGLDELHGTPFDAQINGTYAKWRDRQKQTRMPMVTVLRAQQGKLSYYSVNPAPSDIALSKLPQELLIARQPPKPPVVAPSQKAPPPMLPPLIVTGRKPTPAPAQTTAELAQPGASASLLPTTANSAPQAQAPQPAPPMLTAAMTATTPQTNVAAAARLPASPPAPIKAADRAPQPAFKMAEASSASKPPTPAPVPATETSQTALVPLDPPKPGVTQEPALAAKADEADSPPVAATPSQPPAAATITPTRDLLAMRSIAIVALLGMATAGGAIWLWKKRTPPVRQVSLITRSLDREPQRR
jgi:hypothetical protein